MEERLKAAATEQKASALKATRNASMNGSMNGSMAYILPVDQQLSLEPDSMQGKLIFLPGNLTINYYDEEWFKHGRKNLII